MYIGVKRILLVSTLISTIIHPRFAIAERYIEISRSDFSNKVTLFDVDSPKVNPTTNGVEFKYRTVSDSVTPLAPPGKVILEYTAVAWCRTMSLWDIRVDGVQSGYKSLVKEFYKVGRGWLDYPHLVVTNFNEPHGKLVAAACDIGDPHAMDELMQAAPNCMNATDLFTKAACSTSTEMRGNMALLLRRIERIGDRCENMTQLKSALSLASQGLKYCYGNDKCIWQQLKQVAFAVQDDVRQLESWEASGSPPPFPIGKACSSVSVLKKQEEQKAKSNLQQETARKATEAFFACAKKNIAKLDDKRSDAAVIAKVIYRPCSNDFYDVFAARNEIDGKSDLDEIKKEFEDKLLELVLTNRSSSGKGK